MNHIYRIVFNHSLGVYQCVSELAKAGGKSSGRSAISHRQAGVVLSTLSITVLGMLSISSVQATNYNNGQTTVITTNPYLVTNDVVENTNTVLQTSDAIVGQTSSGTLIIRNKAKVDSDNMIVGNQPGADGKLTVTGNGSSLLIGDNLTIGNAGKGSATIADGASVIAEGASAAGDIFMSLGRQVSGEGNLTVTGTNSTLFTEELLIGHRGKGIAKIEDGGLVQATAMTIGNKKGSEGKLTVTGTNSKLIVDDYLEIGYEGKASATIANEGFVQTYVMSIGSEIGSEGDLTVTGANSELDAEELFIGLEGKGSAIIKDGGSIQANGTLIGEIVDSEGSLIVTGKDSKLSTRYLVVGAEGKGSATVAEGGSIQANGRFYIGEYIGGEGNLIVTGSDSTLSTPNSLYIGLKGKGSAIIADGGSVQVDEDVYLGAENGSEGNLTVTGTNSKLITEQLFVGSDNSRGNLNIVNNGLVVAKNVSGFQKTKSSVINFDNGTLELASDAYQMFDYLDSENVINLATGGGTINTNAFNVSVSDDARITGIGDFTKAGTGQLSINSMTKAWMGNTNINQGVLELYGDYIMRNGEVLGIGLNSATDYGQLKVVGDADISKGILMVNASNAVQNLTGGPVWNNVVSASNLNSEFSAVNDNSPLVGFVADYSDADTVHLRMVSPPVVVPPVVPPVVVPPVVPPVVVPPVVVPPVVVPPVVVPPVVVPPVVPPVVVPPVVVPPVVVPPVVLDTTFVQAVQSQTNQTALDLASTLDQAIQDRVNNSNNALADALISNTLNFNNLKLAAAANELQPLLMGATNRIITDTNYAATEAVIERSLTTPNRGVWAKIIGSESSHDEQGGITGYDADSYGAIVGIDTPINNNLNLGVAFSYIDSDVDSNSRTLNHEMTAKNWQVLGYGNYAASDATQVNFHAGAGSSDVEGQRHITVLTNATADSDYSVDTLQAGFGIGHRIGNELRNFTPFAQMNYARAESDGYRETGAGVYNLDVDENTYESLRWTAGVKMSQALTPKLALTGQLAAAIENGDKYSDITASFVGMPNDKFTTIGQEVGREIGIAGIGLSYSPTANMKISAGYRGEWRDNYDDQGASIALQTRF